MTSSSADNFCTYDYMSRGECTVRRYTSDLPEQFQYFNDARLGGLEFFDGCPTVRAFTNGRCTDTSQPTQTPLALTYGANSRCFQSSNVLQNGFNSNSLPEAVCLESQCTTGGQVQFKIGNSAFQTCASDGQVIDVSSFSSYTGRITCPVAARFCTFAFSSTSPTPSSTPSPVSPGPTTANNPGIAPTDATVPVSPPANTISNSLSGSCGSLSYGTCIGIAVGAAVLGMILVIGLVCYCCGCCARDENHEPTSEDIRHRQQQNAQKYQARSGSFSPVPPTSQPFGQSDGAVAYTNAEDIRSSEMGCPVWGTSPSATPIGLAIRTPYGEPSPASESLSIIVPARPPRADESISVSASVSYAYPN